MAKTVDKLAAEIHGLPDIEKLRLVDAILADLDRPDPETDRVWANEGWARLAKNLKAEIDEERIEAYRGTVSLPFEPGEHKRIAVKIVDDRGIESLKVVEVAP
jgi:hypothetical protein